MRIIKEYYITSNSYVYNKLRKKVLFKKFGICDYCKYHRGCNRKNISYRSPSGYKKISWKKYRKQQYRIKNGVMSELA